MFRDRPALNYSFLFAALMIVLMLFVYNFNVPNPNMILIAALVLSTSVGGAIPGAICAALMMGYSLFFFSTDHSFFRFTEVNVHKIIVIAIGVAINFTSVALLKRNRDRAQRQLTSVNEALVKANGTLEQTNAELAKANEQLKAMASNDSLTHLRNRYALRQDFELYVGLPLHLGFLDLDDFKHMNDTKGHAYGDKMLATVGKALSDSFRTANCYRYGGDEFLIVAENDSDEAFAASCEEAKRRLKEAGIRFSCGYVSGVPETVPELRSMIMQADAMLYEAKETGKDRFVGRAFDREYVPSEAVTAHNRSHLQGKDAR